MNTDYVILDNKNGTTDIEGDIKVIQYSGENTNSENFILTKNNNKKIEFSFFKINGIYYININNQHIIDYKKFVNIQYITNDNDNVKMKINNIGEIIIPSCDLILLQKSLEVMNKYMKKKTYWFSDLVYLIIH